MKEMDNEFNSFGLIRFVWKWKYWLIAISVVTAILSFFFSTPIFIKPQFKATAIVYAPRTNSVSKILNNEQNYNERLDIKAYAVEEETEQMMQILNSREMKDVLIKKFNLAEHYAININKAHWQTKLYKTVTDKISIKRTEFGAISISVLDCDNVFAANMANEITVQLDTLKNKIEYERAYAAYNLLQNQVKEMDAEVQRIDDSLSALAEKGVFMLDVQTERLTQQYALAVAQGNNAAISRLQAEMKKLAEWGPTVLSLQNEQLEYSRFQALCKSKMLDAKMDMNGGMPVKFVVEKAIPIDKKAYPKKSIIVILSTLSAFILTLLILLVINNISSDPLLNRKTVE